MLTDIDIQDSFPHLLTVSIVLGLGLVCNYKCTYVCDAVGRGVCECGEQHRTCGVAVESRGAPGLTGGPSSFLTSDTPPTHFTISAATSVQVPHFIFTVPVMDTTVYTVIFKTSVTLHSFT